MANTDFGRARVLLLVGRYSAASAALDRADAGYREIGDALGQASVATERGKVLLHEGHIAAALDAFEHGATVHRAAGNGSGLAVALVGRGRALRQLGRHDEALATLDDASRTFRALADVHGLTTVSLERCRTLMRARRIPETVDAFAETRNLLRDLGSPWNLAVVDGMEAELLAPTDPSGAVTLAERALRRVEFLRALQPAVALQADLSERFTALVAWLADHLASMGEVGRAVSTLESRRAWTFGSMRDARRTRPTHLTLEAWNELQALRTRAAFSGEDRELERGPAGPILWGRTDQERLEFLVEQENGTAHGLDAPATAHDLEALCRDATLRERAVLIAWYPTSSAERLRCLIAAPDARPVVAEMQIQAPCVHALEHVHSLAHAAQAEGWDSPLETLWDAIFGMPLNELRHLDGTRAGDASATLAEILERHCDAALMLAPHGLLQLVPFSALRNTRAPEAARWLIESRPVSHVARLVDLTRTRRLPSEHEAASAFVIANPDGSLPYADREGRLVAGLLRNAGYRLRHPGDLGKSGSTRSDADGQTFRAAAEGCAVIHLATHGSFHASSPFQSSIVLGPGGEGRDRETLTLEEILTCDFSGATVVLSACETAVADWNRRTDVVSLAGAFVAAGAERTLATLWRVDDRSTGDLVASIYRKVFTAGGSWSHALRSAQLAFLNGGAADVTSPRGLLTSARQASGRTVRRAPYHWAALQLLGQG